MVEVVGLAASNFKSIYPRNNKHIYLRLISQEAQIFWMCSRYAQITFNIPVIFVSEEL